MKTKILITILLISTVLVFGCTSINENEEDILNEIDESLIDNNEIETGEMISDEENIQSVTNSETISEEEEVEIGEMI